MSNDSGPILAIILCFFVLLTFGLVFCVSADETYPYNLETTPIASYIEKSTADKDLFELGNTNGWRVNWDAQRQEFGVIGICSYPTGTIPEIEKMAKEKIYLPRYNSNRTDPYIEGLAPHSLHFDKNGAETFIPFHFIVYPDGNEVEMFDNPLIKENCTWTINQVPWAMGNWSINCRSIVICALGDGTLTEKQAKKIRERISKLKDLKSDTEIKSRLAENQTKLLTA